MYKTYRNKWFFEIFYFNLSLYNRDTQIN